MRKELTYSVPAYLVASAVLAGFALLSPSASAAPGERLVDRAKERLQVKTQPVAQGREATTPQQTSAPAPASSAAAKAPAAQNGLVRPGWTQPRSAAAPSQPAAPGATPAGNVRPPERVKATPRPAPVERRVSTPARERATPTGVSASPWNMSRERPARAQVSAPAQPRATPSTPASPRVVSRERSAPSPSQVTRTPAPAPRPVVTPATPAKAEARRLPIPKAGFRGPGSEANVRTVSASDQKQAPLRWQSWVREQNRTTSRPNPRPAVDVIGNRVPSGATFLSRTTPNFGRMTERFGTPRFPYLFTPGAAWNGHFFSGGHQRHTVVVINYYYPFYYSRLDFGGLYYGGYYPSVYCYFGWAPAWVYPERVYYAPSDYIYAVSGRPRLDQRGAARAITDVRRAWLEGDIDPLAAHLTDRLDVRIYFEGEYAYSTAADDFYAMTLDAMSTTWTRAMDFDRPIWISSHEVFYTGRQVFDDPDGFRHTVYVSYRFRNLGGEWFLVAVGSSPDPIEHRYTDFRYR